MSQHDCLVPVARDWRWLQRRFKKVGRTFLLNKIASFQYISRTCFIVYKLNSESNARLALLRVSQYMIVLEGLVATHLTPT